MAGKDTTATGTARATRTRYTSTIIIYALLLLARFASVLLPGYVHPDEFYQGGQELLFGVPLPTFLEARLLARDDVSSWAWVRPPSSRAEVAFSKLLSSSLTEEEQGEIVRDLGQAPDGPQALGEFNAMAKKMHQDMDDGRIIHRPFLGPQRPIVPTWEFQPRHAIRSIVPPLFMTALPLRLYEALRDRRPPPLSWTVVGDEEDLSGFEIWVVPRLFLVLLSVLAIDWPCCVLLKRFAPGGSSGGGNHDVTGLLVLASSWPALVFFCRPFTNTLETMVLAVLLVAASGDWVRVNEKGRLFKQEVVRSILVGMLSGIGLFVRFTFAFFALPPVMMYAFRKGKIGRILGHGALVCWGFLVTSLAFIQLDTLFYSRLSSAGGSGVDGAGGGGGGGERATIGGYYITPLNALLYNSNVDNLGEHGIHPRITHLLVNLPMLFGPLAFFFYADVGFVVGGWLLRGENRRTNSQQQGTHSDISRSSGRSMCLGAMVSGLFVLSCAPHQEPRFLLPAIVPLVVLYGMNLTERLRRWLRKFWILFNALLLIFFGLLHQSGVVRSLLASHEIASAHGISSGPSLFVYHHTYMPPSFLTRTRRGSVGGKEAAQCIEDGTCSAISTATSGTKFSGHHIVDLKDADISSLQHTLNVALLAYQTEGAGESGVFVVNPSTAQFWPPFLSAQMIVPAVSLVAYQGSHITTEDLPPHTHLSNGRLDKYASLLHLNTHKVSISSRDGTLQHSK